MSPAACLQRIHSSSYVPHAQACHGVKARKLLSLAIVRRLPVSGPRAACISARACAHRDTRMLPTMRKLGMVASKHALARSHSSNTSEHAAARSGGNNVDLLVVCAPMCCATALSRGTPDRQRRGHSTRRYSRDGGGLKASFRVGDFQLANGDGLLLEAPELTDTDAGMAAADAPMPSCNAYKVRSSALHERLQHLSPCSLRRLEEHAWPMMQTAMPGACG